MAKSAPRIPRQVFDLQRQMIGFQKAAFDTSFRALVALQDQQRSLFDRFLAQMPNLPEEGRTLLQEWADSAEQGRDQFKGTVDESFAAFEGFLERMADESKAAPAPRKSAPAPRKSAKKTGRAKK